MCISALSFKVCVCVYVCVCVCRGGVRRGCKILIVLEPYLKFLYRIATLMFGFGPSVGLIKNKCTYWFPDD